jgi:predicted DNA-binding transcriptional regulator YafY
MSIWDGKVIEFTYLNHRGVMELRRAVPTGLVFQKSEYYDGEEWFVVAWCLDRQAERTFMLTRMGMIDKAEDQSLPWRVA